MVDFKVATRSKHSPSMTSPVLKHMIALGVPYLSAETLLTKGPPRKHRSFDNLPFRFKLHVRSICFIRHCGCKTKTLQMQMSLLIVSQ